MSNKKPKIHLLKFRKKHFRSRYDVKRWLKNNGYKLLKYKKQPIENGGKVWKVRQRYFRYFRKSTMSWEKLDKGVTAHKGLLK